MIRKQRMELGLGAGGVRNRKQSPTFGGKFYAAPLRCMVLTALGSQGTDERETPRSGSLSKKSPTISSTLTRRVVQRGVIVDH